MRPNWQLFCTDRFQKSRLLWDRAMNHPIESSRARPRDITNELSDVKLPVTVADIMTRDVVTVSQDRTLADAIALIAVHRFHHLIVTNVDGKLVGILSDRDLLAAVARKPNWQTCEVTQVMTTNPVIARPEMPLSAAISEMLSMRFNSFPVIDETEMVIGIITSTDLLRAYQKMVELMKTKLQQLGMTEFSL
jgi:acetoin utilization protein AcuB